MSKNPESFKELRIDPIQNEKVKEHISKKKTKSPKKKHHKPKEAFTKNKTTFLDEQDNDEKPSFSPEMNPLTNPQNNNDNTDNMLKKPAEKTMMKSKSKEFKGFAEDAMDSKQEDKKSVIKNNKKENGGLTENDKKKEKDGKNKGKDEKNANAKEEPLNNEVEKEGGFTDEVERIKQEENGGLLMAGVNGEKEKEKEKNEKINDKEEKEKKNENDKKNDKKGKNDKKEKEKNDKKEKEKNDKEKKEKNDKEKKEKEKNDKENKEKEKNDKEKKEKEKNDKKDKNEKKEPNLKNAKKEKNDNKSDKNQNNENNEIFLFNNNQVLNNENLEKSPENQEKEDILEKKPENAIKSQNPDPTKTPSKPDLKVKQKPNSKIEVKKEPKDKKSEKKEAKKPVEKPVKPPPVPKKKQIIKNQDECDSLDTQNLQKSQKYFAYMKFVFTMWTLPVLILNVFDSNKYYQDAILSPDINKYSELKMYAFLGMVILVSLVIVDLLLNCYLKGKKSRSLTQFVFGINYFFSIVLILGYFSFYMWQIWDSQVQFYSQIYIQMLVIFVIMVIISVRSLKLQVFIATVVFYYVVCLLIYLKYYKNFEYLDIFTLIKLGEIFTFMIIASLLSRYDPYDNFKPIFEDSIHLNSSNSKPISSILIKDKKAPEDHNITMIEMDKNLANYQKKLTLEGLEKSFDTNNPKKSNFDNLKKNQSMHSISEIEGDSKKWLKVFNNLANGVLILDRSFQIIYTNRKINKYVGQAENEKSSFSFQSGFENLLPSESILLSNIELPQILETFIQGLEMDILLKKISKKYLDLIDMREFFSDLKYVINEALNSRNSMFYQTLKQQTVLMKYTLNQKVFELLFYAIDLKNDDKDYLVFFFKDQEENTNIMKIVSNENFDKNNLIKNKVSDVRNNILLTIGGELRHPINIIVEMLEKMKDNFINIPNFIQLLDPVYQNSYLIFNYINCLFDLSKINIGTFRLILMEYDLNILIDHLVNILRPQALKRGVDVTYSISKKLPKLIFTDPLRLMQILYNLLKNSIKFTNKGTVKLSIEDFVFENELFFQFEIKDNSSILYSEKTVSVLSSNEGDFLNLEIILTKKLVKELGVPERNSLLITSQKNSGNTYKFFISNKRNGSTADYIENLEDGLLESNYIEKKNKNIENFKETICSEKDIKSSNASKQQPSINQKYSTYSNFSLFKAAMNNHYCFCSKILIVCPDVLNLMLLQNILVNLGYIADFCADFTQTSQKINERINFPTCGKYCSKYEMILVDGDSESGKLGKFSDGKIAVVAFFENEAKWKENYKKLGVNDILNKNFNQEEIGLVLVKYLEKKSLIDF